MKCQHGREGQCSLCELMAEQQRKKQRAQSGRAKRRLRCSRGHNLTLPDATYSRGECKRCQREKATLREARMRAEARARVHGAPVLPVGKATQRKAPADWLVESIVRLMDIANGHTGALMWEREEARKRAECLQRQID